jgi:hypothetical protein
MTWRFPFKRRVEKQREKDVQDVRENASILGARAVALQQ